MLVCRAGRRRFAVPIAAVIETMRPLPADPMPGLPPYVTGVSLIRGEAVPVIDVVRLLDGDPADRGPVAPPLRLVTLTLPGRVVALAVTEVLGVEAVPGTAVDALAPLLSGSAPGVLAGLTTLDGELVVVLDQARLVPEAAWAVLDRGDPAVPDGIDPAPGAGPAEQPEEVSAS